MLVNFDENKPSAVIKIQHSSIILPFEDCLVLKSSVKIQLWYYVRVRLYNLPFQSDLLSAKEFVCYHYEKVQADYKVYRTGSFWQSWKDPLTDILCLIRLSITDSHLKGYE